MASVISLLKSIDRSKLHAGVPLQSFSMGEVILIGVVGWFGRLVVGWLVGGRGGRPGVEGVDEVGGEGGALPGLVEGLAAANQTQRISQPTLDIRPWHCTA